ncbi:NAD(P)-binding protein [Multifurca ochricompacta]|uniref:D-xylose 1-dehydrogenase (NADP(+), D-xylono-1,5-lactone-forming) n=1 Tax=Multifurca ochricompacta TaxID=376703 RepID=A0AAD4QR95_9AGAM|nr:NAD(P)-binding protein [Multifurca ochricompacta]
MATQKLLIFRWGIISTGAISTAFVKDILLDPKTRGVEDIVHKVTAVGSRSIDSASSFVDKLINADGSVKIYGNYAEVYNDPNVDAVYIGTPHTLHYLNASDAIKSGKHVLVEKPATTNTQEFRSLVTLAKQHGVFLMEAMWTRFQPVARAVKQNIDLGVLGAPVMVHADLSGDFDIENIPLTHRILDPNLGGGAILDLGPYPLVWAIITLYEHPENNRSKPTVSASMVKTPLTGVDRSTCFTLNFSELAAQAQLSCNINIPPCSISATLRFRNGNILIPAPIYCPRWYIVQHFDKPGSGKVQREETIHFEIFGGGWHFQADEVARCVCEGRLESSVWGHEKTLLEMEIFDEVHRQGEYRLPEGVEQVI